MKEIECCLVCHLEENLRLCSETRWPDLGYFKWLLPELSFSDRWSSGMKTLGTRLDLSRVVRSRPLVKGKEDAGYEDALPPHCGQTSEHAPKLCEDRIVQLENPAWAYGKPGNPEPEPEPVQQAG